MFVYVVGAFAPKKLVSIKVGVTGCVEKRIKQIQTGQQHEVRLIALWDARGRKRAFAVETDVKHEFGLQRMRGEWYHAHLIRRIRSFLSEKLGSPCEVGDNSRSARQSERFSEVLRFSPEESGDLQQLRWLRENGLN